MLLCYQFLAMLFLQFENNCNESFVLWSATGCCAGRRSFTMLVFQPYAIQLLPVQTLSCTNRIYKNVTPDAVFNNIFERFVLVENNNRKLGRFIRHPGLCSVDKSGEAEKHQQIFWTSIVV